MFDLINGVFELCGGLLLFLNVYRLIKDKQVRGVSLLPVTLWTLWGLWNLAYYPSLDQWFSFAGGLVVVFGNMVWLSLAIYYTFCAGPRLVMSVVPEFGVAEKDSFARLKQIEKLAAELVGRLQVVGIETDWRDGIDTDRVFAWYEMEELAELLSFAGPDTELGMVHKPRDNA